MNGLVDVLDDVDINSEQINGLVEVLDEVNISVSK